MKPALVIQAERPDQPDVLAALGELDTYLATLYAPEDNHIVGVQALLAPDVVFLAARDGGRLLGTGAFRQMPGEPETDGRPYAEIKRMYVDPAARGRGVGAQMIAALEAAMQQAGCTLALLETGSDQVEAVRLYERAGYLRRAAFGGYPDNGLSLFYEKSLVSLA
jgi:putative acetyltransferase